MYVTASIDTVNILHKHVIIMSLICISAVVLDGCNIEVYVAWAIVDFFEWSSGFHEKFGFFHVPLDDPTRPRSSKESALWFRYLHVYTFELYTLNVVALKCDAVVTHLLSELVNMPLQQCLYQQKYI